MKKIFDFGRQRHVSSPGSTNSLQSHGVGKKIESGASYRIPKKERRKIHKAACMGNVPEMWRLLLINPEMLNDRDRKERTALHLACVYCHPEMVNLLTERKCELNLTDNKKRTPLMKAVQCQDEKCVSLLLERGADPNIKDAKGYTALHHAALGKSETIAAKLLQHQADVEARTKRGFTPLLLGIHKNHQEMVEFLIRQNANIHAVDNQKRTALMLAVKKKSCNTVRLLLKQGVDLFAKDVSGWTVKEHARFRGFKIKQLIDGYQREMKYEEFFAKRNQTAECSKKDTASSLSCKPGIDGSTLEDFKDFKADTKKEASKPAMGKKENVKMSALGLGEEEDVEPPGDCEQRFSGRCPWKYGDHFTGATDQRGENILTGEVEAAECSKKDTASSLSCKPGIDGSTLEDFKDFKADTKKEASKPAMGKKENVKMSALGLGEEEDVEPPGDCEQRFSGRCPWKYGDHFTGATDQRGENILTGEVEEVRVGKVSTVDQVRLDGSENNHSHVVLEQNDTQRPCSQKQNERILKDAVLSNDLFKEKVSENREKENDLLHEIAKLRLQLDRDKNQNQEVEKKYFEDIAIVKEKNDQLQKTIKLNEETLTKTIFQYTEQLKVLRAEIKMLTSERGSEKQNKERLETEVESYHSRLATVLQDIEQSQKSKRDVQLAFQRAREEWIGLWDKMNNDMSTLKDENAILSQELSKAESKFSSLETEFRHIRDALRHNTLLLQHVHRDLSQEEETEHMYQSAQGKVNTYIARLESLEEKYSHLQTENALLQQQLDDAPQKSHSNEKKVIKTQDLLQDFMKVLQPYTESKDCPQEKTLKLISESDHLKERLYQRRKDQAEREVFVQQLQKELADTVKKQTEASLEGTSHHLTNLESETKDLKKTSEQMRCHLDGLPAQPESASSEPHLQQAGNIHRLEQKSVSMGTIRKQCERLRSENQELREELVNLKGHMAKNMVEKSELERCKRDMEEQARRDVVQKLKEVDPGLQLDGLPAQPESASSEPHLQQAGNIHRLEQKSVSMGTIRKQCERLRSENQELREELVNLKGHMAKNMVEKSELERCKRDMEEQARRDVVQKLKEVDPCLQGQAAAQGNVHQFNEYNSDFVGSIQEYRIKTLEFQLSKVRTSEGFYANALHNCQQAYMEELKARKSLEYKLNSSNERLAEIKRDLLLKEQRITFLTTALQRPVLEPPGVESANTRLRLSRNPAPRENLVISKSTSRTSSENIDAYCTKIKKDFYANIRRELQKDAAKFQSESHQRVLPESTDDLIKQANQDYVDILNRKYML